MDRFSSTSKENAKPDHSKPSIVKGHEKLFSSQQSRTLRMAVRTWLPIMLSTAATPSITLCPSCCCRTMLPKRKMQMRGYFFRATQCSYLAVDNVKTLSERSGTAPLLEKLRNKFIQETTTTPKPPRYHKPSKNPKSSSPSLQEPENDVEMKKNTKKGEFSSSLSSRKSHHDDEDNGVIEKKTKRVEYVPSSFSELPLSEEVLGAVEELNISVPTEVQALGIRAILRGQSIFLASHTGSGKTLAYLLPLVQLLRKDEAETGLQLKPKRPRAMVLCPTRELCEQVYHVAKSIAHRARFRSVMLGGGVPIRGQEEALAKPIDMVFGTPGRILKHIEKENLFYGDVKYVVLDEADTMFDEGFGPDLRKFLTPLRKRAAKTDIKGGFQSVLVSATCTKDVQELLDEEFKGIKHIHTSTLHKRIDTARHEFIKIAGSENKLETLLQVLEPSLSKGNKVMVFCNTLGSSRAIDHYLAENDIVTLNYHGAVPAEQRVESLNEFRNGTDTRATLVCTDLAARGLDLAVDHVIMFDFPHNPIDYLHRTGRTARMGAEGRVTSLVTKRDEFLASKIEDAVRKNEDFDSISLVRDSPAVARSSGRTDTNKSPTASGNPKARSATSRVDGLKVRSRTLPNKGKYTVSGHEGKERPFQKKERKTIVGLRGKTRTLGKERKKLKVTTSFGKQKTKDVKAKLSSATKNAYPKSRFEGFETGASNASVKKKSKSKRKPKSTNKVWKDETPASSKLSVVSFKGKKSSKSS